MMEFDEGKRRLRLVCLGISLVEFERLLSQLPIPINVDEVIGALENMQHVQLPVLSFDSIKPFDIPSLNSQINEFDDFDLNHAPKQIAYNKAISYHRKQYRKNR